MLNYYIVETQDGIDVQVLLTKIEKSSLVETAYLQEEEASPAERLPNLSVNPYDEPRLTRQGYLEPAPLELMHLMPGA